jgi:CRP-like cAMP-binding protein
VCFDADAEGALWAFELSMSLLFLVDAGLSFNTAFQHDDGSWEYDRGAIARHYLLGWFWVDFPSALPVELIEVLLEAGHRLTAGGDEAERLQNLVTLRFLRLFRLFRLLRLLKIKEYVARLEEAFMINLRILKLVEIFVKLGFIAHLLGCGFFYMHVLADEDEPTWVSEYDGGSAVDGSLSKKYLYAIYWSLTTMSTVGYGDITPANDRERWFATFALVVGALSFALINGSVVSLLSSLDNQSALVEGKMEAIKEYVQWRSLPKNLVIRMRRYYEHYYTRRAVFDENEILTQLNPQLHTEVVNQILSNSIGRLPLFGSLSPDFARELFPLLKPISFVAGDAVYKKGSNSRSLYFLLSGEIDMYRGVGEWTEGRHHATSRLTSQVEIDLSATDWTGDAPNTRFGANGQVLLTQQNGEAIAPTQTHQGIFGQAALLGRRREATAIAHTSCEALLITKDDVLKLFEVDPLGAARMCNVVLEDYLRMERLSILALRLRVLSSPPGSPLRSALTIQLAWRQYSDALAQANDPVSEQIAKEGHPSNGGPSAGANPPFLTRSKSSMSSSSRNLSRGMASFRRVKPRRGPGDSDAVMDQLGQIMGVLIDVRARVDKLEGQSSRTNLNISTSKTKGGSSVKLPLSQ